MMKQLLGVSVLAILTSWVVACAVETEPQLELGKDSGDGGAAGAPILGEGGVKDEEPSAAVCGDGVVDTDGDETCDDANTLSGDGCSSRCAIESGYECPEAGAPCVPISPTCPAGMALCADVCVDVLANSQHCGDCDQPCAPGEACSDGACTNQPFCGDGVVQPELGEECDDGVNSGLDGGCLPGCVLGSVCGDGIRGGIETCDDGNVASGDGCSASCYREAGWVCPTPGQPCVEVTSECPVPMLRCAGVCVNVLVDAENCGTCGVACDDGEICDAGVCFIDPTCADVSCPDGEICRDGACVNEPYCGDGVVQPELGEECDLGPDNGQTGECDANCQLPSTCGDAMLSGYEQCDDANTVAGDGCSEDCTVEPGYYCPAPGEPCVQVPENCPAGMALCGSECVDLISNPEHCGACGNLCGEGQLCEAGVCLCAGGMVFCGAECIDVASDADHCGACANPCDGGESCVDGVCAADPACVDVDCPSGTRCVNGECVQIAECGNGVIEGDEQCDDGNSESGDGCAADCTVEPGYY